MPLKINKPIAIENQQLYNNDIKTYSGFYFDNLSVKTIPNDNIWSSIAVNENNGHSLVVANTAATTGTNAMLYSADGGDIWANISLSSGTNNWKSVIYGGGKFVAVSASGTSTTRIVCSTGANVSAPTSQSDFTFTTAPQNNNWESITHGNGYFIAVANSGTNRVMTSTNGTSWIIVDKSFLNANPWESITYSNELKRFVAVASNGKIVYADFNGDSDSWKESSIYDNNGATISVAFNQIIWSSKLKNFIAVGNSGKIMRSENGESWKNVTFSGSNNFISAIWSQELEILILITTSTVAFSAYTVEGNNPIFTTRNLIFSGTTWSYGIWNRFFGSFIIVSSAGTSGQRVLTSKISGTEHFLEKKYYYDLINLSNSLTFEYTNNNIRSSIGSTIKSYPLLNELLNFTFSSLDTLPTGITLNSSTGEITCSAIKLQSTTNYRIIATSELFTLKSEIKIYISSTKEQITNLEYSENYLSTDLIESISLLPSITSGTDYTYSFSVLGVSNFSSLPSGINFNSYTGIISGTPTEIQRTTGYRITATNSLGSSSKDITITIYLLKTTVQSGDLRGDVSTIGEWLGFISYFYSNSTIIGGKINKNYFFNDSGQLSYNNILTVATRKTLSVINGISYPKKEFIFTVFGDYTKNTNLINWTSINISSYSFLLSNAKIEFDSTNKYTRFIWEINDTINYFPNKDNEFYIVGKKLNEPTVIALSGLSYGTSSITLLTGVTISYKPTITNGFPIEYKISQSLPDGLFFNTITGEIYGTTPFISNDKTYIITASNSNNSITTSLRIRIVYFNSVMTVGKTTNNLNIGYEKTIYGSFNPNDNFKNGNILKLSASVSSGGVIFNNINFKINKILSNDDLSAFKQIIWNSVTYPRSSFSYETNISDSSTQFTYNQQSNLPFNFSTFIDSGTPSTTSVIIE